MKTKHFGWLRDSLDVRDKFFAPKIAAPEVLQSVDLRDKYILPPIQDQGQLGSCTANGIASVLAFDLLNKHTGANTGLTYPSRLFIYYNERVIENTVQSDSGAQIRDGIKSVSHSGVCDEKEWPYKVSKFKTKPSKKCFKDAMKFLALNYAKIDNTDKGAIVSALLSGFPVVYGFTVYESFESDEVAKTGVVPMPLFTEQILGGHCVYIVGYDVASDRFTCANSWNITWGNKGFFTIPAQYICDARLASDFWVIQSVL